HRGYLSAVSRRTPARPIARTGRLRSHRCRSKCFSTPACLFRPKGSAKIECASSVSPLRELSGRLRDWLKPQLEQAPGEPLGAAASRPAGTSARDLSTEFERFMHL